MFAGVSFANSEAEKLTYSKATAKSRMAKVFVEEWTVIVIVWGEWYSATNIATGLSQPATRSDNSIIEYQ